MKKIFLTIALLFMTSISAHCSESALGTAETPFSTANPAGSFQVKLDEPVEFDDGSRLNADSILYGKVVQVEDGLRGKRQGYFKFYLEKSINSDGETDLSKKNIVVKVSHYQPLDKKEVAKKVAETGATTVASQVIKVPGISQGVSFVKGVVKAEDGQNRLANGAKQVYKDSPLSYVEKGSSLIVKCGEQVKLHFYIEE